MMVAREKLVEGQMEQLIESVGWNKPWVERKQKKTDGILTSFVIFSESK